MDIAWQTIAPLDGHHHGQSHLSRFNLPLRVGLVCGSKLLQQVPDEHQLLPTDGLAEVKLYFEDQWVDRIFDVRTHTAVQGAANRVTKAIHPRQ